MISLTPGVNASGGRTPIDIVFRDKKLAKVCAEEHECQRRWGVNCRIVQRRLAALLAAQTLADMTGVPGHCHPLHGKRAGQYALNLWGPYRVVFEPIVASSEAGRSDPVDLTQVTAIRILEIVDYHGE